MSMIIDKLKKSIRTQLDNLILATKIFNFIQRVFEKAVLDNLNEQIRTWEYDYLMVSPISGIVNQMGIWSNNQNVSEGEIVFTVIPIEHNKSKGKVEIDFPIATVVNGDGTK